LCKVIRKLVEFCTSSNSSRDNCLDIFNETWLLCAAYFSIFLITAIFWIASVIVILVPLLIYLFGMLVANTWFDGQYEWSDFHEIFRAATFHVPLFISQTLSPDSS
jgi:uncharacterized membrane protein